MNAARNWSVVVLCLAAASCSRFSKKPSADAAAEGGADAAADADLDAGVADAADDAAEDAALAPTTATTAVVHTGGPFAGTYRCFGGLTLAQNGNLVSGVTVSKLATSTQTTQWNCSVVRPGHCEGTEVVTVRFNDAKKPPKVTETRKLSIEHKPDGVAVHLERSTETTLCKK